MGLPRRLTVTPEVLDKRFRELSRRYHPDFFQNAGAEERRASLTRSSYLNDAYRTLRDPAARLAYLIELEGLGARSPQEASRQVPRALLEEVFALNEELDELRSLRASGASQAEWRSRLECARRPIEAKRDAYEARLRELSATWDGLLDGGAPPEERRRVLEALRDLALERNYIANLLAGVEREMGGSAATERS
jgi:molecular chaperone HscB